MIRPLLLAGATAPLLLLLAAPAQANGYGACKRGAAVVDRNGQSGTVLDDSDPAACRVRLSNGSERNYLQWMLSPGGATGSGRREAEGHSIVPGTYRCHGPDASGDMPITLSGPRWKGSYAVALDDGRVGISNSPQGSYFMVCQRP